MSDANEQCPACTKKVAQNHKKILCGLCRKLYHFKCSGASEDLHKVTTTVAGASSWSCNACQARFRELSEVNAQLISENNELKETKQSPADAYNCDRDRDAKP